MKATTRLTFWDDRGEKFFGEGPARLLRAVEECGSLRAAALSMKMAYTKALKILQQAENSLGYPLVTRTTGGKDGGGSVLTPEGERWLAQYEAYRDACVQSNQLLYRQFFPQTGCVIMASGLGNRFGGNKLMADFCGAPMIRRALDATEGLFDRRVVVTRHESVAAYAREKKVKVVLHDLPYRSDTVGLGLEALGDDLACCMFLPGDQPLLRRKTVAELVAHWRTSPNKILRPVCKDVPGSPVIFPSWAFPELLALPAGKGGGVVVQRYPHKLCFVPVDDELELADADTPQMLEALQAAAKQREEDKDVFRAENGSVLSSGKNDADGVSL